MKKFYIIPGNGESTNMRRYKELAANASILGYTPIPVNPNWNIKLKDQIFRISKKDTIFGFSRGAILAYLISKKYPCKLAILGSMTPIHKFSKEQIVEHYGKKMGEDMYRIKFSNNKTPQIRIAGKKEIMIDADFFIPNTNHYLSKAYIKKIVELL